MSRALRLAVWCYAALLRLYPRPFRAAFGAEMAEVFAVILVDARQRDALTVLRVCAREIRDLPLMLAREHWRHWRAALAPLQPAQPRTEWITKDTVTDRSAANLRPAYAGLLAGALLALALTGLRGVILPADIETGWPSASPALTVLSALASLAAPLLGGYVAARWAWADRTGVALRAGLLSGLLAGGAAWLLVGAAGAGLVGQQGLLAYGPRQAPENTMLALLAEVTGATIWLTHLSFWGFALAGALLGGLGGWLHGRTGGAGWGARPQALSRALERALATTLLVGASLALPGSLMIWSSLPWKLDQAALQSGHALRFPSWGAPGLPALGMLSAAVCGGVWLWRRPGCPAAARGTWLQRAYRAGLPFAVTLLLVGAAGYAGLIIGATLLSRIDALGPLMGLNAMFFANFLVLSLAVSTALLAAVVLLHWLYREPGLPGAPAPRPPSLRSALDYILCTWVIWAALAKLSFMANALSLMTGAIAFIGVLTDGGSLPSVPATVQALVQSQLYATLELLAPPLVLLTSYTLYSFLYRRLSPARPDAAAAAA